MVNPVAAPPPSTGWPDAQYRMPEINIACRKRCRYFGLLIGFGSRPAGSFASSLA
jgi:hypothetical protein